MISFIVSTYNRPRSLNSLLACLDCQIDMNFEVLVMDEAENQELADLNKQITERYAHFAQYIKCDRFNDWGYTVKAQGVANARGTYLCFPADDAYYMPIFVKNMLAKAKEGYELVYCNWLFDQQRYKPMIALPQVGHIDVGGFIVKKEVFEKEGWGPIQSCTDGEFVLNISKRYPHERVEDIMYVKN